MDKLINMIKALLNCLDIIILQPKDNSIKIINNQYMPYSFSEISIKRVNRIYNNIILPTTSINIIEQSIDKLLPYIYKINNMVINNRSIRYLIYNKYNIHWLSGWLM